MCRAKICATFGLLHLLLPTENERLVLEAVPRKVWRREICPRCEPVEVTEASAVGEVFKNLHHPQDNWIHKNGVLVAIASLPI